MDHSRPCPFRDMVIQDMSVPDPGHKVDIPGQASPVRYFDKLVRDRSKPVLRDAQLEKHHRNFRKFPFQLLPQLCQLKYQAELDQH